MNAPQQQAVGGPSGSTVAGPQQQPDPWTIQGPAVYYAHAMVIGNPVGGPKGDGTLNATAFYVNGQLYNPLAFAPLAGATMTGPLLLAGDPTAPAQAATKNYVDNHIAAIPPSLIAADAQPTSPYPGQLWWNSVVGQLFIWYADPNSSQWVVCNNALNSISLDMGSY
jgi:hypothetical protein